MNNNGNQKIDNNHRQHQRSDSKRNGDWKRNRNFSGNNYHRNNRPEEQTVIEHDTKPVTDSQEFKVPIKQPLSYARAFRKSSSPLYSDQSKEIDNVIMNCEPHFYFDVIVSVDFQCLVSV